MILLNLILDRGIIDKINTYEAANSSDSKIVDWAKYSFLFLK